MSRHAPWVGNDAATIVLMLENNLQMLVDKADEEGEEAVKTMSGEMAEACGVRPHSDPTFMYDMRRAAAHALKVVREIMEGKRNNFTKKDWTGAGNSVFVDMHERQGTSPIGPDVYDTFEDADGDGSDIEGDEDEDDEDEEEEEEEEEEEGEPDAEEDEDDEDDKAYAPEEDEEDEDEDDDEEAEGEEAEGEEAEGEEAEGEEAEDEEAEDEEAEDEEAEDEDVVPSPAKKLKA